MAEFTPVIDVTEEFFTMDSYKLNDFIRGLVIGLGKEAVVGISFALPEENDDSSNRLLLRRTKAFVERGANRLAAVIATDDQVSIEPNVFCSGVPRIKPETCD